MSEIIWLWGLVNEYAEVERERESKRLENGTKKREMGRMSQKPQWQPPTEGQ